MRRHTPPSLAPGAVAAAFVLAAATPGLTADPAPAATRRPADAWLGEDLPLALPVRTPGDLAVKAIAERQYLIFNLIASGKVAWDRQDYTRAAERWEALLRVSGLDPEIDKTIRPLAAEARKLAGGSATPLPPAPSAAPAPTPPAPDHAAAVTLTGTVAGGAKAAGTVVWLERADGKTPRPAPARNKVITQIGKTFVPRVLPVTVGTKVDFRNQDEIFHNVFSSSKPNDFDAGLYKGGQSYSKVFTRPGPVQILCNIHASMLAYVVVLDTPYYGQADESGEFVIRGVPPGSYNLFTWHERSAEPMRTSIVVGSEARRLNVDVNTSKGVPRFVPDKYGKPRQTQLGY